MQPTNFDYPELVSYFGEEVIQNRYTYLYEKMSGFIANAGIEEDVYISEARLRNTVIDYFTDIYRLKVFHGIVSVNRYKILAFTVFWLLRRQPLQVKEGAPGTDEYTFVNEDFAVSFIGYACITPSTSPEIMYDSAIALDDDTDAILARFRDDVRYHLIYRGYDARNLELMLNAYETGFNLGSKLTYRAMK